MYIYLLSSNYVLNCVIKHVVAQMTLWYVKAATTTILFYILSAEMSACQVHLTCTNRMSVTQQI